MAVSKKCKELLCLFYSALLFISGALLIIGSVFLGHKLINHFKFVPSVCIAPFILLFLLAFLHILLTWLGVKGPRREHSFHIILFIVFTVALMLLELATAIWSIVLWSRVGDKSLQMMENSFQGFVKDNYDKSDWVRLQSELKCCGINNESDYSIIGSLSGSIPLSCCNSTTGRSCPSLFKEGCKEPLIKYVKRLLVEITLVGLGSGLFQILGIVAFYYFYKALKQEATAQAAVRRASRMQEGNPLHRQSSRMEGRNSLHKQNSGRNSLHKQNSVTAT